MSFIYINGNPVRISAITKVDKVDDIKGTFRVHIQGAPPEDVEHNEEHETRASLLQAIGLNPYEIYNRYGEE